MKIISFLSYYLKLRLRVSLGFHITANPVDLKWRWKYWKYRY
ncbi:MAG TPA: hypothetical protein VF721_22155 [Pyrinomonadaceae bacterium]